MNLIKSSYLSAISTSVSILAKLITNKIIAIFIGPSGFAIYGQFKDFVSLTTVLSQLGTSNGIIKYTANTKKDTYEFKSFIATALKIHLIGSLLTFIGIFIFKDWINEILFQEKNYVLYLLIISGSLVFVTLHNLLLDVLNGLELLKKHVLVSILVILATSFTTILAVNFYQLDGLIVSIAINHFLLFAISLLFFAKLKILNFSTIISHFNKSYLKKLLNFSLMSLSGMLSLTVSLLFIRTQIIGKFGIDAAGYWDSTWRISALYLLFLTSSFKFYILPTFSNLKNTELKQEILQIWKITLPIIVLITLTIFVLKDFIIRFLFTPEFLIIKSIILFQLLGDIIRIHSWTLGNILIAKSKTKRFVLLQITWGLTFCGLSLLLITSYNLAGITLAYFLTCIIHFILLNISLKDILWYPQN